MRSMAGLKFYLLGPVRITLDDQPLTGLRSSKVCALLAYLAAEANRPHARETLATLLWGESADDAARLSLRVALSNLRKVLAPLETPILVTTRQSVQLNVDHSDCWTDTAEFGALLATCEGHPHRAAGTCPSCIQRLAKAIELYRGDFLAGLTLPDSPAFGEWRLLQQEWYHRQALTGLELITEHHIAHGNYEAAQVFARRQLALECWREAGHRQLIRALALDGQRGAALAQYEACQQILAEELGVEPEEGTRTLYEQIRQGRLSPPHVRTPAHPHNLPAPLTPFVGREEELNQIADLLNNPACRLLTLLGPGGMGKTRLATQAAQQQAGAFRDGVYFISLAAIDRPERLSIALAEAFQFSFHNQSPPRTQLVEYLREKETLLVLDDFDPPSEAAGQVADLLRHAPGVKVLAVSQERLNVPGEWLLHLSGLDYPDAEETAEPADYSAVQLFVQSARRARPGVALSSEETSSVVRICQLVGGMPLAIELGAAWLRVLSCQQIAREIERDLDFLQAAHQGPSERHRSLRAVFEGSWALLSPREREVFRQLSVFRNGFDRTAAEQIAGATLSDLASLVDKSLLHREAAQDGNHPARYTMHRLLQHYAADRLAERSEEHAAAREQHRAYYMAFLQQKGRSLSGGPQQEALRAISAEMENVRAAWDWTIGHGGTGEIKPALISLFLFYYMSSWFQEGEVAFGKLVDSIEEDPALEDRIVLGQALACQGWFTSLLGHHTLAREKFRQSLSTLQPLGARARPEIAFSLNYLGAVALHQGSYDEARERCRESLAICREIDDGYGAAIALNILGRVAYLLGNYAQAHQQCRESLALSKEMGNRWSQAFSLDYLGQIAFAQEAYDLARRLFEESKAIRQEMGDQRGIALGLNHVGDTERALGDYTTARRLYSEALSIFKAIGHCAGRARTLVKLGHTAWLLEDLQEAEDFFTEALQVGTETQSVPDVNVLDALVGMAAVFLRARKAERALALLLAVDHHTVGPQECEAWAERLLAQAMAQSPPQVVAAARQSAQARSLEELAEEILFAAPSQPLSV